MLHVKYGSFDRLEKAFLDHLREHIRAASPNISRVAVVTPSRRMAERLERLATVEGGLSILGVHFHTFLSLALNILEETGGPADTVIGDPLFHHRLMDMLLTEHADLGVHFGGSTRPKALAAALRASIRDLIDANVSPKDVLDHFGEELSDRGPSAERLKRLLKLQASYQNWLDHRGVMSPSDLAVAAGIAAESSAYLSGFKEIIYYGFYDLTGRQLDFFERVTAAHSAVLFFPYLKDHPAFRFCDSFFDLKLHRDGPPVFLGPSEREAPRLRVFSASGVHDEVWAASKEILRLVSEEGYEYDEIGVVARTLDPYRAAITEVFDADAVPAEIAAGEPLKRHPLAKVWWELLALKRRDFPAPAVVDLLQSPYFKKEKKRFIGVAKNRVHGEGVLPNLVPALIARLGISAGWVVWQAKLSNAAPGLLELLSSLRDALNITENRGWKFWAKHARELLMAYLELPEDASSEETRAWDELVALTDSLGAFEILGEVSWDIFLDAWIDKWETAILEPVRHRGVRVMDAMDARGESFRALFVLGLQEGLFPRQVREDPLLRDEDRAKLRHPGGYWIATKMSGHEEERLLFHLIVYSVREKLYGVYSRSDEEGKAQTPSFYLRELVRSNSLDFDSIVERIPRQPLERLKSRSLEFLSPKELSIRLRSEGIDASDYVDETGHGGRLLRQCLPRLPEFNATGAAGPMDGMTGPPQQFLKDLLKRGLSPSALDTFSRCPFQFFSSYVLNLKEGEPESERGELAASLRGKMYHEILERFYRDLRESGYWEKPQKFSWESMLSDAADAVFAENGWQVVGLYPVVWKTVRLGMRRHLQEFVRWDVARISATGMIPSLFEQPVRGALALPRLPASLRGLEFVGRVDRVDIDAAGRRYQVVDYKTRWRGDSIDKLILRGEKHQWPIYAELVRPELARSGEGAGGWKLEASQAYVLETDSEDTEGETRAQEYSGSLWEQDRKQVLEGVAVFIEEIAQGRFPIRPEDGEYGHCAWCDFKGICRKSHGRSRSRAEQFQEHSAVKMIHDRKR